MPLEINEIGIRMSVRDSDEDGAGGRAGRDEDDCRDLDREAVVEDCVRRVLQILDTLGAR